MQPERSRHEDEPTRRETQLDSRESFATNFVTPMTRTMFRAGVAGAVLGGIIGGLIGTAAAGIYGLRPSVAFVMVIAALAFGGGVAGGVIAGWRGGLADKALDEQRPSYRDGDERPPHGTMPKGWR